MFRVSGDQRRFLEQRGGGDQAIGQGDRLSFFSKIPLDFGGLLCDGCRDREMHESVHELTRGCLLHRAHAGINLRHGDRRAGKPRCRLQLSQIGLHAHFLPEMVDHDIAVQNIGEHFSAESCDPGAAFEYSPRRPF